MPRKGEGKKGENFQEAIFCEVVPGRAGSGAGGPLDAFGDLLEGDVECFVLFEKGFDAAGAAACGGVVSAAEETS